MYIEATTAISDNDEQVLTSFSDLYNLYEIIGKYVNFFWMIYLINNHFLSLIEDHSVSFVVVQIN
jgi:hypothetical protein